MTLLPGDVILTGTPAGVGPIVDGDTVTRRDRGDRRVDQPGPGRMTASESGSARRRPANPHVGLSERRLFNWAYARHTGAPSCSGSRTPTRRATPTSPMTSCWTNCAGSASTGTRARKSAARTGRTGRASGATSTPTSSLGCSRPGHVYESYSTSEEIEARHRAAGRDPKLGYDDFDRDLSDDAARGVSRRKAASRCCGCACPTRTSAGTTSSAARSPSPPAPCRTSSSCAANGDPLYTLVNPVDDALMRITHVLRGEDLLPSTPRQIVALSRPDRHRRHRHRAAVRTPAVRHGGGQQASSPNAIRARR